MPVQLISRAMFGAFCLFLASCDQGQSPAPSRQGPSEGAVNAGDYAEVGGEEAMDGASYNREHAGPPPSNSDDKFCARIQEVSSPETCRYFEDAWNSLQEGSGGVDHPDVLERGETGTITLVLGRPSADQPNSDETVEFMLGREPDQAFKVRVGRKMAAQLQGDGFEISPSGLVAHDLFLGEGQKWEWKVKPIKAPRHELSISTYAVIQSEDGMHENLLKTVHLDVPVRVSWRQRVEDATADANLLEKAALAIAAFLVAILSVWVALKRFGRSTTQKK